MNMTKATKEYMDLIWALIAAERTEAYVGLVVFELLILSLGFQAHRNSSIES